MTDQFESQKNLKASGYTTLVVGSILVIFLFVKWTLPSLPEPPLLEEGMEVNLGSSDMGSGKDQPFEPGPPAPKEQQSYVPPKPVVAKEEDAKDFETDDKDEEAAVVKKPPVTKPEATKVPDKEVVKAKPTPTPKVETPPAPPAPKPKATFKGVNGTGTGGNDADTYKKGTGEGIAGGKGDQGRPGGNPDSKNYTGGGKGTGGLAVMKGDRKYASGPTSFKGDFDHNATIYADIKVDPNGVGEFLRIARGSTTSESVYIDDIRRRLRSIRFTSGTGESVINVRFIFKVTN